MGWMPATASSKVQGQGFALHLVAKRLVWGALAAMVVWLVSHTAPWQAIELKVFDLFTALSAPQRSTIPVVILAIDEPSFQELGIAWPFPRSLHAKLLERLHDDGATAIGMDIVFADPSSEAEDAALEKAIRRAAPVVLASARDKVESSNATLWTEVPPMDRLLTAGAVAGDAGVDPDDDFVVRRFANQNNSFSRQLARLVQPDLKIPEVAPEFINYLGPHKTFDTRSYYLAIVPGMLPAGYFKDKIVLVGRSTVTATELKSVGPDLFHSPFAMLGEERMIPGVELQATLMDNHLTGQGLRSAPAAWSLGWMVSCLLLISFVANQWRPMKVLYLVFGLVVCTVMASWWLFTWRLLWMPTLMPIAAIAAMHGAEAIGEYLRTSRRAQQTRAMFAQYVPPEVVRRLIAQPELMRLGGEVREVTLMFTDLANFTTLSEKQSAEQTVEVLTAYFNAMTPLVYQTGGTVDKFIGDAVMAFWGAPLDDPQHAEHAVQSAVAMQEAMKRLAIDLQARGLPAISMRIGLHSGRVVVGNVGSSTRFSYTAIGDAVNLAARLEGANKAFGTEILLSENTAILLPKHISLRPLDEVIVKGKTQTVRIFTPSDSKELCDLSIRALEAFSSRNWPLATSLLDQVLAIKPADKAATRLLARIQEARALTPDAPWSSAEALDKL